MTTPHTQADQTIRAILNKIQSNLTLKIGGNVRLGIDYVNLTNDYNLAVETPNHYAHLGVIGIYNNWIIYNTTIRNSQTAKTYNLADPNFIAQLTHDLRTEMARRRILC